MNIYEIPCPTCGSKIVSTARTLNDDQAPTNCDKGHTFMRSEAKRQALKSFYRELRAELGQDTIQVKAAERLKSSGGSKWKQNIEALGHGDLVNASLYRVVAERLQDYVKRLKKMGIKQLGSGNFADVFQHPTMPNVVVKLLTDNDEGYESYVKFAQKNKSNKYVPRILQVVEANSVFDKKAMFDMRDLRLVFMEKLEPIHYNKYIDFGEHVTKVSKGPAHRSFEAALMDIETWKACAKQKEDKDLAAVAKFIVKNVSPSIQLDMHDGNVMMRGDKVIITDPFSTY